MRQKSSKRKAGMSFQPRDSKVRDTFAKIHGTDGGGAYRKAVSGE